MAVKYFTEGGDSKEVSFFGEKRVVFMNFLGKIEVVSWNLKKIKQNFS